MVSAGVFTGKDVATFSGMPSQIVLFTIVFVRRGISRVVLRCSFMDRGAFVPDDIIIKLLIQAVGRAQGGGKHTLLDGFPRCVSFSSVCVSVYLPMSMCIFGEGCVIDHRYM